MGSPEMQVIDRAESLSQRAYQSLRKAIRDGAIVHGVLYSEKDLADRLGISRTPVREALIELAREGLVTIAPQRGFQLVAHRRGVSIALTGFDEQAVAEYLTTRFGAHRFPPALAPTVHAIAP